MAWRIEDSLDGLLFLRAIRSMAIDLNKNDLIKFNSLSLRYQCLEYPRKSYIHVAHSFQDWANLFYHCTMLIETKCKFAF